MVYIAGPFFNEKELDTIEKIEIHLDSHNIRYFSPRSMGTLKDMTLEKRVQYQDQIYDSNLRHMRECDVAIIVVDNFDAGTMFEMGFMACLGKDMVTYSAEGYGLNVMLRNASKCHTTMLECLEAIIDHIEKDWDVSHWNQMENATT